MPVLEVGTGISLTVVISVLAVTVIASPAQLARKSPKTPRGPTGLELGCNADVGDGTQSSRSYSSKNNKIRLLRPKYRQDPGKEKELLDLIARARKEHDQETHALTTPNSSGHTASLTAVKTPELPGGTSSIRTTGLLPDETVTQPSLPAPQQTLFCSGCPVRSSAPAMS